jgi:hypothetical protein
LAGLLPEDVRQRQSKAEFSVTYERALGELRAWLEGVGGDGLAGRVEAEQLRRVYQNAVADCGRDVLPGGFQLWGAFGCGLLIQIEALRGGEASPDGGKQLAGERTLAET